MLTNVTLTDAQGTTHTDAVFKVYTANRNKNSYERQDLKLEVNNIQGEPQSNGNSNVDDTVRFELGYWTSQASYDAQKAFYLLTRWDTDENGNARSAGTEWVIGRDELAKAKYDSLSLEEVCELYFTDEILPTLQEAV